MPCGTLLLQGSLRDATRSSLLLVSYRRVSEIRVMHIVLFPVYLTVVSYYKYMSAYK